MLRKKPLYHSSRILMYSCLFCVSLNCAAIKGRKLCANNVLILERQREIKKRETDTVRELTDSVSPGDEKTDGHPQQDMNRGDLKTSWAPAASRFSVCRASTRASRTITNSRVLLHK